jgi:hypothetical protein
VADTSVEIIDSVPVPILNAAVSIDTPLLIVVLASQPINPNILDSCPAVKMDDVAVQASDAPTIATCLIAKNVDIVSVDTCSPRKMPKSMVNCAAESVDAAGLGTDSASLASETIIDVTNLPANIVAAQIAGISRKHASSAPPPT